MCFLLFKFSYFQCSKELFIDISLSVSTSSGHGALNYFFQIWGCCVKVSNNVLCSNVHVITFETDFPFPFSYVEICEETIYLYFSERSIL